MVSFITEATERSLLHLINTVSVPDISSYFMDTGGLFSIGRATGHEVDQLPPIVMRFKAESHIAFRAHAVPLPCSDSAVSFMKVRVVAGNIGTASSTV
jgi:hypothetical protein